MGSRGLGDDIHSIIQAAKAKHKLIAKAVDRIEASDCGCNKRRNKLNELFPIKK